MQAYFCHGKIMVQRISCNSAFSNEKTVVKYMHLLTGEKFDIIQMKPVIYFISINEWNGHYPWR